MWRCLIAYIVALPALWIFMQLPEVAVFKAKHGVNEGEHPAEDFLP